MSVDPVLPLTASAFSAGLLCLSALAKRRAPLRFRAALQAQAIFPARNVAFIARLIAPLELAAATLAAAAFLSYQLTRELRIIAATVGVALYLGFALALMLNLLRGRRDIDCGCFFSATAVDLSPRLSYWQVVRNLALAVSLASLIPAPTRAVQPLDYATALGFATLAGLILTTRAQLNQNARRAEAPR